MCVCYGSTGRNSSSSSGVCGRVCVAERVKPEKFAVAVAHHSSRPFFRARATTAEGRRKGCPRKRRGNVRKQRNEGEVRKRNGCARAR
eukprot:3961316-Prymnesium_polylepis.1